jgi:hypothetical protein
MAASRDVVACITVGVGSLAPQSVFQSANGVLHLAFELISFAFAFELAVAGYLSNNFLHFAIGAPAYRFLSWDCAAQRMSSTANCRGSSALDMDVQDVSCASSISACFSFSILDLRL